MAKTLNSEHASLGVV